MQIIMLTVMEFRTYNLQVNIQKKRFNAEDIHFSRTTYVLRKIFFVEMGNFAL